MKIQLQAAIEFDPKRLKFRFTLWVRLDRSLSIAAICLFLYPNRR
jgi:hypothetical protein